MSGAGRIKVARIANPFGLPRTYKKSSNIKLPGFMIGSKPLTSLLRGLAVDIKNGDASEQEVAHTGTLLQELVAWAKDNVRDEIVQSHVAKIEAAEDVLSKLGDAVVLNSALASFSGILELPHRKMKMSDEQKQFLSNLRKLYIHLSHVVGTTSAAKMYAEAAAEAKKAKKTNDVGAQYLALFKPMQKKLAFATDKEGNWYFEVTDADMEASCPGLPIIFPSKRGIIPDLAIDRTKSVRTFNTRTRKYVYTCVIKPAPRKRKDEAKESANYWMAKEAIDMLDSDDMKLDHTNSKGAVDHVDLHQIVQFVLAKVASPKKNPIQIADYATLFNDGWSARQAQLIDGAGPSAPHRTEISLADALDQEFGTSMKGMGQDIMPLSNVAARWSGQARSPSMAVVDGASRPSGPRLSARPSGARPSGAGASGQVALASDQDSDDDAIAILSQLRSGSRQLAPASDSDSELLIDPRQMAIASDRRSASRQIAVASDRRSASRQIAVASDQQFQPRSNAQSMAFAASEEDSDQVDDSDAGSEAGSDGESSNPPPRFAGVEVPPDNLIEFFLKEAKEYERKRQLLPIFKAVARGYVDGSYAGPQKTQIAAALKALGASVKGSRVQNATEGAYAIIDARA